MENLQKATIGETCAGIIEINSDTTKKALDRTFDDYWTGWLWPEDEVEPPCKLRRVSRSFTSLRMAENTEGKQY